MTRAYDDGLANTGMTITQFAVLRTLVRQGELPLSRLADLLVMDRTSLYRLLAPIERQGWVQINTTGGRAKRAAITDAGHDAMLSASPAWERVQAGLIGAIGATGWAALRAQLDVLGTAAHAELGETH